MMTKMPQGGLRIACGNVTFSADAEERREGEEKKYLAQNRKGCKEEMKTRIKVKYRINNPLKSHASIPSLFLLGCVDSSW
ncbi:hypothetical protein [Zavarzinella formosa]|uniref:hypothetical protein n=1 Tax=Zavarzinella formosa TaxID=360055 RepID=UPI0012FA16B7|nr:hypothetical protein [Zavarzinella formosa]